MEKRNLTESQKGSLNTILKINASGALKQRLLSFGIIKGAQVELLEYSPTKSTVEIRVGKMSIALRHEEAELIELQ